MIDICRWPELAKRRKMEVMKRLSLMIAFLLLCFLQSGMARAELPASVVRIASGDTILVEVFVSPYQRVHFAVCLTGIDTPDLNARCMNERLISQEAMDMVKELSRGGVDLIDLQPGCYPDRAYARVRLNDGRELSDVLLAEGLARPISDTSSDGWCSLPDMIPKDKQGIRLF